MPTSWFSGGEVAEPGSKPRLTDSWLYSDSEVEWRFERWPSASASLLSELSCLHFLKEIKNSTYAPI